MLHEFKRHIENRFRSLREDTFLLACSGGVDSVVLAHLCARCQLNFAIAHCNFKLRGEESDADEEFVRDLAKKLKKPFFVIHFDTMGHVDKHKVSIQMAARELRYHWFAELMKENRFKTVVTAHQADDNLETFLINLSRGTGIDGLAGIPEQTNTLARPLLQFSREQIIAYAKSKKITWREDSSNLETKYLRNKIRQQIVPRLKELHPTFLHNFHKTQEYLAQTSEIAENHIKELKSVLFQNDGNIIKIKISSLLELHPLKAYVYALFNRYGFTEWDNVIALLYTTSGKEINSKTHRLLKDRDHILLQRITREDSDIYEIQQSETVMESPVHLSIEDVGKMEETSEKILYVDRETLKYPLTVRKWQKGDYFYPFGMAGKKKVSKYFKDEKIDVVSKKKQWLLCSGEDIVWIIGKRADNRFKVAEKTKNIVKFTLHQ